MSLREAFLRYKCIIFYFYDTKNLNFDIIGLDYIPSVLELTKKQETFKLNKTNMSFHGKPVFFLVRGYPRNIEFNFMDDTRRKKIMNLDDSESKEKIVADILKEPNSKVRIIERIPNTFDVYSDVSSIYTNRAFLRQRFELRHYVAFLFILITAILITYMITSIILNSEINHLREILIKENIDFTITILRGLIVCHLNPRNI